MRPALPAGFPLRPALPVSLESAREEAGCQLHRGAANGARPSLQGLAALEAAGLMAARAENDLHHHQHIYIRAIRARGSAFLWGWGATTQVLKNAHDIALHKTEGMFVAQSGPAPAVISPFVHRTD